MVRRHTYLLAFLVLAAACSAEEPAGSTTTSTRPPEAAATTAAPTATTVAPTTTTSTTTSTTAAPTATTAAPLEEAIAFNITVKDETDPALPPTESGWDASFSYSPWVVFHDGQFHMFYTGWRVNVAVGYAVSDNGLAFERVGEDPVFEIREDIDGRTHFAEAPVVYVADDGTWVMYYGLLAGKRFPATTLHRATAPAPAGPWTPDPEPIYTAEAGEWDDEAVPQSLTVTDDGVYLYYDGRTGTEAESGVLFSADGISFTPYDDPATPYGSDPVVGAHGEQAWDGAGAGAPMVFPTEAGFEMFYVGFEGPDSGARSLRIGYAVSPDGLNWSRFIDNPIIEIDTQTSAPASLGFPWMGGLKLDDTYYLYYALAAGAEGVGVITLTIE